MINIGIFTIFTNNYKDYFDNFVSSLHNFFPGEKKELCILSDGLQDKNNIIIGDIHINVKEIIDLPYPYINTNKFQFINEYNKKMKFDYVAYFDADTIFIEKDSKYWEDFENDIKSNKIISSRHPFYTSELYDECGGKITNFMQCAEPYFFDRTRRNHDDLSYVNGEFINEHQMWIITSFFIINKELLNDYAEKIKKMIRKCNMEFALIMKFSDEVHFNLIYYFDYLNNVIDEKYIIKDYITLDKESNGGDENVFICQKYNNDSKTLVKYCKNKGAILLVINNDFDETFLYKLYSKYIYDFNFIAISKHSDSVINKYVYDRYMWHTRLVFWDDWFDKKNVFFNEKLYDDYLESSFTSFLIIAKYDESIFDIDLNQLINHNIEYKSDKTLQENKNFNNLSYMFYSKEFIKKNCMYNE